MRLFPVLTLLYPYPDGRVRDFRKRQGMDGQKAEEAVRVLLTLKDPRCGPMVMQVMMLYDVT